MTEATIAARDPAQTRTEASHVAGALTTFDELFMGMLSAIAAILLAIEIVVLFVGIVARYVFHHPLIWTDEFNSILFLWLGTLGSALALRHWQHMRMTTFVAMLPPRWQDYLSGFALVVVLVFLLLLLPPSLEHVQTEAGVISPSLEISMFWRAAAMPVGIGLMIISALLRLRTMPLKACIASIVVVAAATAGLALLQDTFLDLDQANLVIFFLIGVPLMVFTGIPIAFAFGAATFAYLTLGTYVPPSILVARLDAGMSQLLLLAIPTFVFLGLFIEMTGMAERMIAFLSNLLGHMRGGLQYVLVAAMYLVSGISGSKAADMAAIAPALFPEMEKLGNDRAAMTALLAATGAQTETVPPSLILIAVGSVTGLSIAGLFTAGLLPSALLGVMLCAFVWYRTRKEPKRAAASIKRSVLLKSFCVALPALALPFVIRSAVVEGVATATEVSTIGIVYTLIIGLFLYRQFEWKRVFPMLAATATLSGAILFVTGAATGMAWAITQSGFSQTLADAIAAVPGGVPTFMALSILLFALLGSVLEGLPAIVLFGPLMFPIAQGLGINDIYYAIVAILAMSLGLFTPPFGVGFYITCAIGGADPNQAMRHLWPYLAILTVGVVIIAMVPLMSIGFIK
ncbi:TRAP transporter large permease [Rhizobium laguerreae]|uniref:TRAP transporter large permease n=1 Tax=Rhizobium laguerreae TaxID=1076926 RepID=UPI001C92AE6F|nr:TRAP transporter large permease subunit [Rhizobium laguerreae]